MDHATSEIRASLNPYHIDLKYFTKSASILRNMGSISTSIFVYYNGQITIIDQGATYVKTQKQKSF